MEIEENLEANKPNGAKEQSESDGKHHQASTPVAAVDAASEHVDNESTTSSLITSNSSNSNGKLKIDLSDVDNPNEKIKSNKNNKRKSESANNNDASKNSKSNGKPINEEKEDNEASNASSVKAANLDDSLDSKSGKPARRKTINRGLDGGYWGSLPTNSNDYFDRRKRTRTSTDRLDLSALSVNTRQYQVNQMLDESIASESNDDNENNESGTLNTSKTSSNTSKTNRFVLFKPKSFLAVRNEDGTFFLCQATHNIYEDSKKCKIQWLEDVAPNKYKFDLVDWVDPAAIICKVNVKRVDGSYVKINDDDLKNVQNLLAKAIKDGGITVEFSSSSDDENNKIKHKKDKDKIFDNRDIYDKDDDQIIKPATKKSKPKQEDKTKKKEDKKLTNDSKQKAKENESFSEVTSESSSELSTSESESEENDSEFQLSDTEKNKLAKKTIEGSKSNKTKPVSEQKKSENLKPTQSKPSSSSSSNNQAKAASASSNNIVKKSFEPLIKLGPGTKTSNNDQNKKVTSSSKISSGDQAPQSSIQIAKKKKINDDDTDELDSDQEEQNSKKKKLENEKDIKKQKVNNTNVKQASPLTKPLTNSSSANKTQTTAISSKPKSNQPVAAVAAVDQAKKRRLTKVLSNRFLEENTRITVYNQDPFFEETESNLKDPMPYISPVVQSKLAFKAIYLNDMKMLESLINDFEKVPSVHIGKGVYNFWIPAEYALYMENKKALELLVNDYCSVNEKEKQRVQLPEIILDKYRNGIPNPRHLGIPFVRKLTESRGAKEGNNAFTKDQGCFQFVKKPIRYSAFSNLSSHQYLSFFKRIFDLAYEYGCSTELFDFLLEKWKKLKSNNNDDTERYNDIFSYTNRFIYENVYRAVLFGKRKLAAHVLENAPAGHGFNAVHIEVLKADNDADLKCQLRANMCTKKPYANDLITPIHCACINPNVKYLKTLLSITQDFNISDKRGRKPVHYAAVCEGPTPLEYLISRVSPYELDSMGNTPLHFACLAGRGNNVEILLSHAQSKQEDDSALTTEMLTDNKYGLGGINKPNKRGKLPIHLAISRNNYDCVRILVKYECNLEYPLPNSMDKITPLMYACQLGHNKIVKLLIENGAKVEARDRFQRTALIHAATSGDAKILSYLLRLGANPNASDSSGNSALHYACAYGWYYPMKLLLDAGANVNTYNDWKLTAFGAAFLKGHMGICDTLLLLNPTQIDINFRTDQGETLVMLSVSSSCVLTDSSVNQLNYVINKLGGDCKLVDSKGNNAFHYLASNRIDEQLLESELKQSLNPDQIGDAEFKRILAEKINEQKEFRYKMSDILLAAKCNPNKENNELESPLFIAIQNENSTFARYLLTKKETKCKIKSQQNPSGKTLLSLMSEKCTTVDMAYILFGSSYNNYELVEKYSNEFETMAKIKDENGLTPFQIACVKLNELVEQQQSTANFKIPENIIKYVLFLYKNCKSNPNELIELNAAKNANKLNKINDFGGDVEVNTNDYFYNENDNEEEINLNYKKNQFCTPIFKLINDKCIELVDALYSLMNESDIAKIDFNFYDSDGLTPFLKAITLKQTKFAFKLIDLKALSHEDIFNQISKNQTQFLNENLLQLAVRNSQISLIQKLVDLLTEQDDSKNSEKILRLLTHCNVYKQNFLHIISSLEHNERSLFSRSFLTNILGKLNRYFIKQNNKHFLFDLLNGQDKLGRNPLHLCLLNRNVKNNNFDLDLFLCEYIFHLIDNSESLAEYKEKYFCQKDVFGRLPLHYLFIDRKVETNTFKIASNADLYKINDIKSDKNFASNIIIFDNDGKTIDPVELLNVLVKQTAKSQIDEKDAYGYTPLHYAAVRGSTISCSLLINNGCGILTKSILGNTPLSSAVYFENETLTLTLLNIIEAHNCKDTTGSKITLKDNYYLNPSDYQEASSSVSLGIENNEQLASDTDEKEPTLKWNINLIDKDMYPVKHIPLLKLILSYKWEGISWLILGSLENYGLDLFDSIEQSLLASQFGLALRLIEKYEQQVNDSVKFLRILTRNSTSNNRNLLHQSALLIHFKKLNTDEKDNLIRIFQKIFDSDESNKNEQYKLIINDFLTHKDSFGSIALHYACFTQNFDLIDIIFKYLDSLISNSLTAESLLTSYMDASKQTAYSLFFWHIGRINYTKETKEKIKQYTNKYVAKSSLEQVSKAFFPFLSTPNFITENRVIEKFVNDYPLGPSRQQEPLSPLLYSINRQNFDMCRFLIKDLGFDVNVCDSNKICALVYAIKSNNLNLCKILLNSDYEILVEESNPKAANVVNVNTGKATRMKALFNTMGGKLGATNGVSSSKQKQALDDDEDNNSEISEEDDKNDEYENNLELNELENQKRQEEKLQLSFTENLKFKLKSNIVLTVLDKNLKTIFHHLACSLDYGSFQNIEICRLLFSVFNNLNDDSSSMTNGKVPSLSEHLKRVDSNVITASDYAIKNGNIELYEEFRKVLIKANSSNIPPQVEFSKLQRFSVNDKFYLGFTAKPNYLNDSDLFLNKYLKDEESSKEKKNIENEYFKVDPMSNMNKIGCLVWDEEANLPYDCILTKTDVSYGLYGMHNFYKMQLITHSFNHLEAKSTNNSFNESSDKMEVDSQQSSQGKKFDESQMCVLFTRWGRIGDKGMCQRTPFSNFREAKEEFHKLFKQKTGNDFVDTVLEKRKAFENKPRRYNLVKFESRSRPKLRDIEFDLFEDTNDESKSHKINNKLQIELFEKSKFNSHEYKNDFRLFWIDLLDVNFLKNEINTKTKLSASYLPLTQLSTDSIMKASEILNYKLKPLIERRMELEKLSKKEYLMEYMNLLDRINEYSNEFYELIPQMNYNYEKLVPISNERELDAQLCTINQLNNAQIACRILMGAKYALKTQNPFDYVFHSTNCKLERLNPNTKEAQYILRYVWPDSNNENTKFKIKRIFKFERPGEQDRFDKVQLPSGTPKLKNRLLLWHGTGTENLISIMSKGLVKAPNDAKWTGHRFGKGIYFSDSFEASSAYSTGRKQLVKTINNNTKLINRNYMLLCEVALGKVKELRTQHETLDSLPSGYDSVKALGRKEPDPNNVVTLPNGVVIPLGEKRTDTKLLSSNKPGETYFSRIMENTQYVIYNESQIVIRYILQYYSE